MKIAHISDIHWRGLSRHAEYTRTFEAVFAKLLEIRPDLIFLGGDFFHTKTSGISPEVIDRLAWMFKSFGDIAPTHAILGNHDCFTEDHELLTRDGWESILSIVEAKQEKEVATFNSTTEEIEFQLPHAWISKFFTGELLHLQGKELDALVTPTHEFLYGFSNKKYYKTAARNLPSASCIPISGLYSSSLADKDWFASLLGFAFAEGTFVLRNAQTGTCRIQFHLKSPRELSFLKLMLEQLAYKTNFRMQQDGTTVVCIYETLAKRVFSFFEGKKEIPNNIFAQDKRFLRSFLEGYLQGDGGNKKNAFWTFRSISESSRDTLVTIARLVGANSHSNPNEIYGNYPGSGRQYSGSCNLTNRVNFTKVSTVKPVPFSGMVYCVTVQNSNLLVRRNGKIFVAGNCNLSNEDRQDVISPIVKAMNHKNVRLYKKSTTVPIFTLMTDEEWNIDYNSDHAGPNFGGDLGVQVYLNAFSCFDKEGWANVKPVRTRSAPVVLKDHGNGFKTMGMGPIPCDRAINIAAFHGSVGGSKMDNGWVMPDSKAEVQLSMFQGYDFVLLGDIHKRQFLAERPDKNGVMKPYVAYPGSTIQQNHGEEEIKGFLVWDIRAKDDWDVEFVEIANLQPFITIPWKDTVEDTAKALQGSRTVLPGSRYRVASQTPLSPLLARQIEHELKTVLKGEDVIFKAQGSLSFDTILSNGVHVKKASLRNDRNVIHGFYKQFLDLNPKKYGFTKEQWMEGLRLIDAYMDKLALAEPESARDVNWSLKSFEFDNLYRYGPGNKIDFDTMNGVLGVFGKNKTGKALALNTEIPTTKGWKTIGDIEIGDEVYTPKGAPTKVVGKSPIFHNHTCFLVKFSDKTEVIADADHLWTVEDHYSRIKKLNIVQTLTTRQLKNTLIWREQTNKIGIGYEWSIATTQPVQYHSRPLPIHPYVLGCWLGDGTRTNSGFTCADQQIIDNIIQFGEVVKKHNTKGKSTAYAIKMLAPRLRKLGLLNNKHIPENYMLGSIEDRQLLLAGLLDTDGYSSPKNGMVEFCNTNTKLAEQVRELACSLGYKAVLAVGDATLNGRFISKKYRVTFMPHKHVFRLDRKNANIRLSESNKRSSRRFITSIKEVKREPVQCLVVEDHNHLFLITRSFIATHNSSLVGALMYALFNGSDRDGVTKNGQVMNQTKKSCFARAVVNVNGTDYIIERTSTRAEAPKRGKRAQEGFDTEKTETKLTFTRVNPDGTKEELNGTSRDETDKAIRKLLGTSQDFLMTSVATQRKMEAFIDEGATARKAILNRFLDLDIFEKLYGLVKEDVVALNAKTSSYTMGWEQAIKDNAKAITSGEEQILELDEQIAATRASLDELRLWIAQHESSDAAQATVQLLKVQQELFTLKRQQDRTDLDLNQLNAAMTGMAEEIQKLQKEESETDLLLLQANLNKMRSIQAALQEATNSFKDEERVLSAQEKSVRKLALVPCGDQFPTCHYIAESHEDKRTIEAQKAKVASLGADLAKITAELKEIQAERYEEKMKRHFAVQQSIKELTKEQVEKNARKALLEKAKKDLALRFQQAKAREEELARLAENQDLETLKTKKAELQVGQNYVNSMERQRSEILVQIGRAKATLEQIQKDKVECEGLLAKLKVLESVQAAFHKNGIPAIVLKTQLPAINAELDKLLGGLVDFKITFETEAGSNVMDIFIEDGHSRRILELGSGMEKMLASIAIRVALTNLSSLPKSDIFVIDEGFNALDEEHVGKCLELLQSLKGYFKSVLVISHMQRVKEAADNIIEVNSTGLDSRIEA